MASDAIATRNRLLQEVATGRPSVVPGEIHAQRGRRDPVRSGAEHEGRDECAVGWRRLVEVASGWRVHGDRVRQRRVAVLRNGDVLEEPQRWHVDDDSAARGVYHNRL